MLQTIWKSMAAPDEQKQTYLDDDIFLLSLQGL